jgi:cell division protein FtsB
MGEVTEDKIELSQQQTRNWALLGVVTFLLLLVQGFFTFLITSTGTELRETNRSLVDLVSTVKVHQAEIANLRAEIAELKEARKDAVLAHRNYDTRLGGIEQALALHNQWISSHNH